MYQGQWTIGCMVGFSNCNTRRLNVHEMASVARRGDAQQLDDREAGFLFQQSEHAIQIMNCSLDQLLNLHSDQPAIAGSPTSVTVHKFAFDPGMFRLHRSVFLRQLSLPLNFIFGFVIIERRRSATFLVRRDTRLHQRARITGFLCETKTRRVTSLIALRNQRIKQHSIIVRKHRRLVCVEHRSPFRL